MQTDAPPRRPTWRERVFERQLMRRITASIDAERAAEHPALFRRRKPCVWDG